MNKKVFEAMCRIVLGGSELFTVRCPKLGSKCSQIDIEEWGFWHLCRTLFGDFILLHFCYASFQSREKNSIIMSSTFFWNPPTPPICRPGGLRDACLSVYIHFGCIQMHTNRFCQKSYFITICLIWWLRNMITFYCVSTDLLQANCPHWSCDHFMVWMKQLIW